MDLNQLGKKAESNDEKVKEADAKDDNSTTDSAKKLYSSHPITNFRVGRFQFEKGLLELESDKDVEEFEKLRDGLPTRDKNLIKPIDVKAAERLVRPVEPRATKQFDSSVGRQREVAATGDKVIGDQELEGATQKFANVAQTAQNKPVDGGPVAKVVNEENQGKVQ